MSRPRKTLAELAAALNEESTSRMTVDEVGNASAFFFCTNPECVIPGWMAFRESPSALCPRCTMLGRKVSRRDFEPVLISRLMMESKSYKEPKA